jgi:hypothetical protein
MDFINHFNLIRFKVEHIFLVGTTFINVIILFDLLQINLIHHTIVLADHNVNLTICIVSYFNISQVLSRLFQFTTLCSM